MSDDKSASTESATLKPGPPHRRRKRRLFKAVILLLVLAVVLVLLAPTLISSGPGTRAAMAVVNHYLRGKASMDDLSVGWFSAVRVKGFTLTDPDGKMVIQAGQLAMVDRSLLSLLRSHEQLGSISGQDITIDLVRYPDGSTNLQRALPASRPSTKKSTQRKPGHASASHFDSQALAADVQLSHINLTLNAPDIKPVQVQLPKLSMKVAGLNHIDLDLKAQISQGDLHGTVLAVGQVSQAGSSQPQVNLHTELDALPVAAVDELVNLDGKLTALLGEKLDGELKVLGTQQDAQLTLSAKSQTLDVNLPLHLTETRLAVGNNAQVALTLQPTAYQAWVGTGELAQPVMFHVNFEQLALPLRDGRLDAAGLEAVVTIHGDAMDLNVPKVGALRIKSLTGRASMDRIADAAAVTLDGPFALDGQPGDLRLSAAVSGLSDPAKRRFDVTVSDLPVALADQIAQQNGRAVALVGKTVTLAANGQYPGDVEVKVDGQNLSLHAPLHLSETAYALAAPAHLQCTLSPASYALLAGEQAGALQQAFTLSADLTELNLPLTDGRLDLARLRTAADISATPIVVDVPQVGRMRVDALQGGLHADRNTDSMKLTLQSPLTVGDQSGELDVSAEVGHLTAPPYQLNVALADLPIPLIDQLSGQGGQVTRLIGNTATLSATGTYPGDLHVNLTGKRLELDAPLSLDENAYALSAPAHLKLELRPGAYQLLAGESGGTLKENATIEADIRNLNLPLVDGKPDLTRLRTEASLTATPIIVAIPQLGVLRVESLRGDLRADRASDSAALTLQSPLSIKDQPAGALDVNAQLVHLSGQPYELNVKLADLPVPLIDQWLKQQGKATALVGTTASLNVVGSYPGNLTLTFRSSDLALDAPLQVNDNVYRLSAPAKVSLRLDPSDYPLLMGDKAGTLSQPMNVSATVSDAVIPLTDGKPDFTKLRASATLQSSAIALQMPNVGPVHIDSLNGTLVTDRTTDTAHLTLKGPVTVNNQRGDLDIEARLTSTADGPPYNLDAKLNNVPMPVVDQLGGLRGQAAALTGPTATISAIGQFPGAVLFTMRSRDLKADAPLQIDENNVVTLKEDFTAQLTLNEDSAQQVLGKIHPIIADVIASQKPVKLLIRRDGFQVPLNDFSFDKVRAKGVLDLGQLKMTRRGWTTQLMDTIATRLGQAPHEGTEYVAQFTPADFVVANGKVRSGEMWMTAGNMAIGFQGKANIIDNQYDFQMSILGATLISQVAAIGKVVDPGTIFTIPLKGKLNHPVPDLKALFIALTTQEGTEKLLEKSGDVGKVLGDIGKVLNEHTNDKNAVTWNLPEAAQQIAQSFIQQQQPAEQAGQPVRRRR